jgi:RpiB/LacA/LacB family sugar-phosphate isomerase
MRVVVGSDHAGFELKQQVTGFVREFGHEVLDVGTDSAESVDYPDYAAALGNAILAGQRGILLCGSGVGAAVAANKLHGIRAGVCHDSYSAHQGVEHDDMNVLVMGGLIVGRELARELVRVFLEARSCAERHVRRLAKIRALEDGGRRCARSRTRRGRRRAAAGARPRRHGARRGRVRIYGDRVMPRRTRCSANAGRLLGAWPHSDEVRP